MAIQVEYYFAPASPWAYLGHARFERMVEVFKINVVVRPVDFAQKVFPVSGGIPLENRSPKRRAYRQVDLRRFSKHLKIALNPEPLHFPVDPDLASRLIVATAKMDGQEAALRLIGATMRAVWTEQGDISNPSVLMRLLRNCGIDEDRLTKALDGESVAELERNAELANEAGIFGAPSYVFNGEIFWGQDRLDFLERALQETVQRL